MGKLLKKKHIPQFLSTLMKKGTLYAPITTDMTRFTHIHSKELIQAIDYEHHAFFPPKKYFLPNEEELFAISNKELKEKKTILKQQFIFNIRLCDINAITILDKLYLDEENPDPYYKAKREATILIGLNCHKEIDEYCFCGSMDLQRDYDLLLHEINKTTYYLDVRSNKAAQLVKNLPDAPQEFNPALPRTSKVLDSKNLWSFYADKWWENDNKQCVGCQRCNLLCPTCFCFDVVDEMELDLNKGSRKRVIDACHSPDFTTVAGNHTFRKSRLARYRHRVMHKVQYYKDTFKRSMCTGCGRCIRHCHSKIDWVSTINEEFVHE